MVTLAGSQVWWTWETEDVFNQVKNGDKHAMKKYAAKLTEQLSGLTHMVRRLLSIIRALQCVDNPVYHTWSCVYAHNAYVFGLI